MGQAHPNGDCRNEWGGLVVPVPGRFQLASFDYSEGLAFHPALADWLDPTPRVRTGRRAQHVPAHIFKIGKVG